MGVYIPNLEMPTSCFDCPIAHPALGKSAAAILGCPLIGKTLSALFYEEKRMDDCPLVPVPPHGDLIDLKAPFKAQYYDEMTEEWVEKTVTVEDALYGCMVDEMPPTIIPAEEGET